MRKYLVAVALAVGFFAFKPLLSDKRPLAMPDAKAGKSEITALPADDNTVAYSKLDERMNSAKDRARETLGRFVGLLNGNAPGTYAIKFPLTQNGATEHVWLQVDGYRNDVFSGRLANKPLHGSQHKIGDRFAVPVAMLEDWSVTNRDGIYGNYTARVALADMPGEKARTLASRFRD